MQGDLDLEETFRAEQPAAIDWEGSDGDQAADNLHAGTAGFSACMRRID